MNNKKIYEEAKIEVIVFDCKDILTTSEVANVERKSTERGTGGNIKFEDM